MKTTFNPPKMLLLLLLLTMLGLQKSSAQNGAAPKHVLSYTTTESKAYEIDLNDRSRIKPVEAVGMKPENEVRNVNTVVDFNNDITTTINVVSTNKYESWMKPASKIVIDKNGTKLYDSANRLVFNDPYLPVQAEMYNKLKTSVATIGLSPAPVFRPVTPADIAQMQQQGFTVQTLPGGTVKARKGDIEARYNNNTLTSEVIKYVANKPDIHLTYTYQNSGGKIIPATKVERQYETTGSGVCYSVITTTVYSNYNQQSQP
jgi:hypothetical protein